MVSMGLTACDVTGANSAQAPERERTVDGGGRAGEGGGGLGRGEVCMVGEVAGWGGGRGGTGEQGDFVNVRELQGCVGPELLTWLPGVETGLHLRWEERVRVAAAYGGAAGLRGGLFGRAERQRGWEQQRREVRIGMVGLGLTACVGSGADRGREGTWHRRLGPYTPHSLYECEERQ